MRQAIAASLVGLGLTLLGASVLAQESSPQRISLRWSAPEQCPDDLQLVQDIERLLGQSLREARGEPLSVRARVQGDAGGGYAGKVSFESRLGVEERFLEHPSCDKLVQGIALMIALVIDPERVHRTELAGGSQAEPAPPTHVDPRAPLVPAPVASAHPAWLAPPRNPEPPSPRRGHLLRGVRAALQGLAGSGPLPGFGLGAQASLGYHQRSFRGELFGRTWSPRSEAIERAPGAELEMRLMAAGLRGCWLPLAGAWQAAACLGLGLGELRGRGVGSLQGARTRSARYTEAALSAELMYAKAQLAPVVGLELASALERPRYGVRAEGEPLETFRPANLAVTLAFGLAFEL